MPISGRHAEWTQFGLHPPQCELKKNYDVERAAQNLVKMDCKYGTIVLTAKTKSVERKELLRQEIITADQIIGQVKQLKDLSNTVSNTREADMNNITSKFNKVNRIIKQYFGNSLFKII
jgi:hypothetical protein